MMATPDQGNAFRRATRLGYKRHRRDHIAVSWCRWCEAEGRNEFFTFETERERARRGDGS